MDEREAKGLLAGVVAQLRRQSYDDLVGRYLDESDGHEIRAESGVHYQIEVQAFWDTGERGDLRVLVGIDDGGWRAFRPLSNDFIIAADGSFVGE